MIAEKIRSYACLGKLRISLAAGLSAMTGHVLAAYGIRQETFIVGVGVFLLAGGASALNQYQERDIDALMERTRTRPLPSGELSGPVALLFAAASSLAGLAALYAVGGIIVLAGGLFAIAWYNGLYTFLKKKTFYAFLPGALVGAVSPALGWTAGGGGLSEPIVALCIFFYLWQIPHSWLYAAEYRDEYIAAGLPSITSAFAPGQLSRIIFIWIAALGVSSLFLVPLGLVLQFPARYLIAAAALWLVIQGSRILGTEIGNQTYRTALRSVNLFMAIMMFLLVADKIFIL